MTYNDYSLANALVLFGALQGLILIVFLFKKSRNSLAYRFFSLFLFSLAYVNLWYAFHFMEIYRIGGIPISAIFYPYEFLLGVGFYFYIKSLNRSKVLAFKKEGYLFLPALLYVIIQVYIYNISVQEGNNRIFIELDRTGFYLVVEFIRFSFNILLGVWAFRYINKIKSNNSLSSKEQKTINWLILFTRVFIVYNLLSLVFTMFAFLMDSSSMTSLVLFYLTFFINTVFIYWIGFIGYRKYSVLFYNLNLGQELQVLNEADGIENKLRQIMDVEEHYRQSDFSLQKLAQAIEMSNKELSSYINSVHKCNVSEFINKYRVEKVKSLIESDHFSNYTLEAISYEAGFKSKSSFNSIFKKYTGLTPSQYKKGI